ncbi:hypothetical protein THAOC_26492, partial [Thalassiosira oceanica]
PPLAGLLVGRRAVQDEPVGVSRAQDEPRLGQEVPAPGPRAGRVSPRVQSEARATAIAAAADRADGERRMLCRSQWGRCADGKVRRIDSTAHFCGEDFGASPPPRRSPDDDVEAAMDSTELALNARRMCNLGTVALGERVIGRGGAWIEPSWCTDDRSALGFAGPLAENPSRDSPPPLECGEGSSGEVLGLKGVPVSSNGITDEEFEDFKSSRSLDEPLA